MRSCCKCCANLAKAGGAKAVCAAGAALARRSSSCEAYSKADRILDLRLCTCCGRLLPLTDFYCNPRRVDGYECICKSCAKAKSSESYRKRHPVAARRGCKEIDLTGHQIGNFVAIKKVGDKRSAGKVARIYLWRSSTGDELTCSRKDLAARVAKMRPMVKAHSVDVLPDVVRSARPYVPENPDQFTDEFMMITKLLTTKADDTISMGHQSEEKSGKQRLSTYKIG